MEGLTQNPGLPCPACAWPITSVKNSRPYVGGQRRRRVCDRCHERFTTVEVIEQRSVSPLAVARALHEAEDLVARLQDMLAEVDPRFTPPPRLSQRDHANG